MKEELLLEYLETVCSGRGRAQKSIRLEGKLQLSGDGLRCLVNKLRRRGEPIASGPNGYFYALNAGEVYSTIQRLKKMIRGLEAAVKGLEAALDKFNQGGAVGAPAEAQRSGFGGERRSDGAGEFSADRQKRASEVRDDDG